MKYYNKIRFIAIIISINILFTAAYADAINNIINYPALLYQAKNADDPLLQQKITINRKFSNIKELSSSLNNVPGLITFIHDLSNIPPTPVNVQLDNGTVFDLLNLTCRKLGYTFTVQNGVVVFSAMKPIYITAGSELSSIYVTSKHDVVSNLVWQLNPEDKTLRVALNKWCNKAHWQLVWNVNADYPIITTWNINGSFESAINQVLQASQATNVPLVAIMHDRNRVLEISSSIEK